MDRLSPLDVSFLHMEDADHTAHMHVASIAVYEGPVPPQHEIRQTLLDRMHLIPRCRQRVQSVPLNLARPVWVDAPDFDIDFHLRRTAVAAPGGEDELRALVGRVLSQRLDRTKPLWEMWVVEGLEDGHWATIGKVHHCMVDGVSGAELMVALLDLGPEVATHDPVAWEPRPVTSADLALDGLRSLATDTVEQARAVRSAVRRPRRVLGEVGQVLRGVRSISGAVKAPGGTQLTGPIGSHRVVAWADAPLTDVKAVRQAFGGTVNDVVLAAITSGFRQLLLARGEDVDGREIRTLVPVSVRATRDDGAAAGDGTLQNKVSAMFATLPVGIADPVGRLDAIRRQLATLKDSKQALAGQALTGIAAYAPAALFALGARVATRGAAVAPLPLETVTTNVPGPQLPLYAFGRRMIRVYPYVPIAAPVRISVGIFSYDGEVTFTISADRDTAPDVDLLARGITDGLAELVKLAAAPDA